MTREAKRFCASWLLAALITGLWGCSGSGGQDDGLAADSAGDVTPDASDVRDTVHDSSADTAVDASSDTGADALADTAPDAAGDTSGDSADGAASDTSPDAPGDDADVVSSDAPASRCGDGTVDPGEQCDDGDDGNSDVQPDACRSDCSAPGCGDGVVDEGEPCDDGNRNDFDGCTAACSPGVVVAAPDAGEVVITELMVDPDAASDPAGEWIELHNVSDAPVNLIECSLHDDGTDVVVLSGSDELALLVGPGEFLVVGFAAPPGSDGSVSADFHYDTMLLDNVADELNLTCADVLIDRIAYQAQGWPLISGRALSLDPSRTTAQDNDAVDSWCPGEAVYGDGDQGTPGAPNPQCPQLDASVDFCVLSSPAAIDGFTGHPASVTVDVAELGISDLTDGVDPSPNLLIEIGSGPAGSDPSTAEGWSWISASGAPGWVGGPDHRDRYEAGVRVDAPQVLAVAARASRDGGDSWLYCDREAGSADGFDPALLATLTVVTSPCVSVTCTDPPAALCSADGVTLSSPDPTGECVPIVGGGTECVYSDVLVDCGEVGRVCSQGACGAVAPSPAAPGDLVLTELMITPLAATLAEGQWLELANLTGSALNLQGCALALTQPDDHGDDQLTRWIVPHPMVLPAGQRRVVGATADQQLNGGVVTGAAWGEALRLRDDRFSLALECGGVVIDALSYDEGTWPPLDAGAALQLSPFRTDAADNDLPGAWCGASAGFGAGDRGSPGQPNPNCSGDIRAVDACWIESEPALTVGAGSHLALELRLIAAGLTDLSLRTDVADKIVVRVGYGPVGSSPGEGWTFIDAAADLDFVAVPSLGFSAAEDQYLGRFAAPPPGSYAVGLEVSADGGNSVTYCDTDPEVSGYVPSEALSLTTQPGPCYPDPCGTAPGLACDPAQVDGPGAPTVVVDLRAPSACRVGANNQAECSWAVEVVEDCAEQGGECVVGACGNLPVPPAVGDVVFSEMMIIPDRIEGEWFELSNPHDHPVDLSGCVLLSGPDESWEVSFSEPIDYVLAPRSAMILARSPYSWINGGVAPRAVYQDLSLANAADWIQLHCGTVIVDTVAYNIEDDWDIPVEEPLAVSGNQLDAVANNFARAWCGVANHSANVLNRVCPPPDTHIDDCRVVAPSSSVAADGSIEIGGLLRDAGVTDVSVGGDAAIGTRGQVGFGAVGTSAAIHPDWLWSDAMPDDAWRDDDAPGYDRWVGQLSPDQPGTVAVAFRFSVDDGETWTTCDANGSANGLQISAQPTLFVDTTACKPNPCNFPAASVCEGTLIRGESGPGSCDVDPDSGDALCSYEDYTFSCALFGGCDQATGTCAEPPSRPTLAGDVVFSEIMADSLLAPPDRGEWIELYNAATKPLDLRGCTVSDDDDDSFQITAPTPVVLNAGDYFVIAASDKVSENGYLSGVDHVWSNFLLNNVSDEVVLRCAGKLIDRVAYDYDWPSTTGRSMQLDSASLTDTANDDVVNWCDATPSYGGGNKGTPGGANTLCL